MTDGISMDTIVHMAEVIRVAQPANSNDESVWYDIAVCHHADGRIETWTKGVASDDPVGRLSCADALRSAASHFDRPAREYLEHVIEDDPTGPEAQVRRLVLGWMQ